MKKLFILIILSLFGLGVNAQTKGNVTQIMAGGRIVDGREVISGDLPFKPGSTSGIAIGLSVGTPFSVMVVPKSSDNVTEVTFIKGKYYQGDAVRLIPLVVNSWNTTALIEIDVDNPTLFTNYNVYVGFGQDLENN